MCYETVVRRPDFEEELPPSSLLLAPSQKTSIFFSIIIIPTINNCGCSLFFLSSWSFLFPSNAVHISLLHICSHNLPSNCVQSASNVLQLGPSLICFLFLLHQLYSISTTTLSHSHNHS